MPKDKHLERIKAIKRASRIDTGGPHGRAGIHSDKRERRVRHMGTKEWLEEVEEEVEEKSQADGFRWHVYLYYWDQDGERHLLADGVLVAHTKDEARTMAMDEWWDPRLDAASCVPDIELDEIEEE